MSEALAMDYVGKAGVRDLHNCTTQLLHQWSQPYSSPRSYFGEPQHKRPHAPWDGLRGVSEWQ